MVSIRRVLMLGTLTMLGAALSGCIVLPYGARHGRHGHHVAPSSERPVVQPPPTEYRRHR